MNPLVSIIVPVYNVEKYLDRCVDSILQQSCRNLEILLVDDGATDASGAMCDRWAETDSRIRAYHKTNGGLSDARNFGIDNSCGEYLFFVDSDDYIHPEFLADLLRLAEENNAAIVAAPMCHVSEQTSDCIPFEQEITVKIFCSDEAIIESCYQREFSCNAPSKLFRADVFQSLRFPVGKLSEDLAIAHKLFEKAERIVCTNKWGYFYRQREKSIMHSFNVRRLDALDSMEEIARLYAARSRAHERAIACRTLNIAVHLILDMPDNDLPRERMLVWNAVKKSRAHVIFNRKARLQDRAAALLSYGGPDLLKKIWESGFAVKRKEF